MDIRQGCGDFPPDAKIGTETQANECSYKTASGELISDRGRLRVQGTTEYGYGLTFQDRKADVHKTLISPSKVHSKGHVAVVDLNGGYIIPNNRALARNIQQFVQNEIVKEPGSVRLYLENGTYIYPIPAIRTHMKRSRVLFDACKTAVGSPSHPQWW